jgi:hypothetical protein
VWFGGVEDVMPLLATREYHSRTRYGYYRCMEPVLYIGEFATLIRPMRTRLGR